MSTGMWASKAHGSFRTLTQRALQDWSQFSSVCGNTQGYFGKPLTDSFLFDTDTQALSQTYLEGIAVLLQSTKCAILGLSGNSKAFRRLWSSIEQWSIQLSDIIHAHDSHYLDDATVWTVLEKLQELVYNLLRGGVKYARDSIYQGPQMLVTSQLYLKVIQSHHPNIRRLRFLLELSLMRYTEIVTLSRLPRTEFYPFTKTSRETIMDCFRRSITRIQDPTITFEDRLHIHTFVLVISRSSLKYSRVLLANRALYWLCTSLSCFPPMLAANPGKYRDEDLGPCLAYLADQFNLSGPEYMSEALDADILDTMLKLDKLFPGAYDIFIGMFDSIHKGLIFRGVERRVRKALDKIDQHSLDADLQPGRRSFYSDHCP
ncbi:hypothetical protein EV421DRAFT_1908731 [Armillaria borealis]|uniref:Uncharacterized protein n=1 Tax=Armillaria borealis TaxID=47425 RepID=A0AA39J447_9AGAR|nr:hypothetical protein EV421DRAFT_1908731 [Armillaria borealis]